MEKKRKWLRRIKDKKRMRHSMEGDKKEMSSKKGAEKDLRE